MSDQLNTYRDADIDIAKLFASIWRAKFRILVVSTIVTFAVFFVLASMAPTYRSDARLLIEANDPVFTRPVNDSGAQGVSAVDEQAVASQTDILTSSELLIKVAKQLNLGDMEEFDPALDISPVKSILIMLGLVSDPRELTKDERVLMAVRENLQVYAREKSRIVVIEFETEDKDLAARFPNALAQAYLELESRASLQSTGDAATYLAGEIEQLQRDVRNAEKAVADFRASSGLLQSQNNEFLATQQLAEITTELSRVRSERASAEARAAAIQSALNAGTSIDSLPDVIDSAIIGRLREQEINLRAEIAERSVTLLDNHPQLRALRSQLAGMTEQIRLEARKVLQALRSEVDIARNREASLAASLNELKAASVVANEQEVELNALERQAASQRALLESYLIRFREAQSRQETDYAPANARIVSSATTPDEPNFPKMIPSLAAAFVATFLLMCIVTLLRELFSGNALVVSGGQAGSIGAMQGNTPEAHHVPSKSKSARRSAANGSVDQASMADSTMRPAAAMKAHPVEHVVTALIESGTSALVIATPEGEVAAQASVAVAREAVANGVNTILLDLSGTGAPSGFMVDPYAPGITDLLTANAAFADVIHLDDGSDAHCIPTGQGDPARAARATARLTMIVDALADTYQLVVIDTGTQSVDMLLPLVDEHTEILVGVVSPGAPLVHHFMQELADAGFGDVNMVDATVRRGRGARGSRLAAS